MVLKDNWAYIRENLKRPQASRLWNPLIAHVFYRRGIIETWGRGALKMREITVAAGLPPPEFECQQGEVVVRFRPTVRWRSEGSISIEGKWTMSEEIFFISPSPIAPFLLYALVPCIVLMQGLVFIYIANYARTDVTTRSGMQWSVKPSWIRSLWSIYRRMRDIPSC
ncbi:MAG: hypothetical protein EXS64_07500 [Candidatus Latescibacteria bacterium]|nr:hypothetical protein [Candidatus Latescibacterota bacterium]